VQPPSANHDSIHIKLGLLLYNSGGNSHCLFACLEEIASESTRTEMGLVILIFIPGLS
jgi:hypothetical protein